MDDTMKSRDDFSRGVNVDSEDGRVYCDVCERLSLPTESVEVHLSPEEHRDRYRGSPGTSDFPERLWRLETWVQVFRRSGEDVIACPQCVDADGRLKNQPADQRR